MGIADKLFQLKNDKAATNLKAGQDFLAANKEKPGVTALPSGLQYEVITEGAGAKPTATQKVTCHYHGTLIDGTVFDSSVKRGQPATFPLNMVIKGWTEGLQLMGVGSKWRFFIPANLGYGDRQVSAQIGPNSTLVFEVELLSIS
ncbi:MAG TPA: FKBP-type peptidyl-prolyl cis-trans isomerase [Panacibacter sp.]|nr:FKBP-type peptidyl-prolyl cis-trans isomerase [Panacibacter sp.]